MFNKKNCKIEKNTENKLFNMLLTRNDKTNFNEKHDLDSFQKDFTNKSSKNNNSLFHQKLNDVTNKFTGTKVYLK